MIALVLAAVTALAAVGVDEHVGDQLPPQLVFASSDGHHVTVGSMFESPRPKLLILTYVRCKMLCSLVLRGAIDAVRGMSLVAGRDYDVVLVSIDPTEDAAGASARLRDIGSQLGHAPVGWTYLTGTDTQIHALAAALGFRYALDPRTDLFAHPAVIFIVTPDGRIARYMHGVQFAPPLVEAALREAAHGQVTATAPEAVLSCFLFDPAIRAHRVLIERYLRVGGAIVLLGLASLIGSLIVIDMRRRRRS